MMIRIMETHLEIIEKFIQKGLDGIKDKVFQHVYAEEFKSLEAACLEIRGCLKSVTCKEGPMQIQQKPATLVRCHGELEKRNP